MKKTGVIILSAAAVAAAGAKLWISHLDAKEREKWRVFWEERHAEAAAAREKAVAAVKEAAEKGKQEAAEAYTTLSDATSDTVKHVADAIKPANDEKEVLGDLHGALSNYLESKKSEEAAEEPETGAEVTSETEDENVVEEKAEEKKPAPPVDADSDEEPLPAWDTVPAIGEGEGQIAPNSDEYLALIKEAIEKAEAEPTYHLVLGGKTYGLGAKGKSIGGDTAYNLDDLRKLLRKAEQGAE